MSYTSSKFGYSHILQPPGLGISLHIRRTVKEREIELQQGTGFSGPLCDGKFTAEFLSGGFPPWGLLTSVFLLNLLPVNKL
jgi:hypothetical protein